MTTRRIVVLAGAGLVADAGLPTSVALASRVKESLERSAADDSDPDAKSKAQLQLKTYRFLNGALRFQLGVLDRDPDQPINIEQIAAAAIQLQARFENPLAPYVSGWHQRLVDLERASPTLLTDFIDYIFQRLNDWLAPADDTCIAYLARFAEFVNNNVGLDIATLNYDLCIETALTGIANHRIQNGFDDAGWDSAHLNPPHDIRLLKLHGSLDWIDDQAYGICACKFPRHRDAEDIEGTSRPLLIFGTYQKLSAQEPFLTLVYTFSQLLLKAPVLVVIGYSFGDGYINDLIGQALRINTRLKVLVVAPHAESLVQNSGLALTGSPRLRVLNQGAKTVLNDGVLLARVKELLMEADTEAPF